MAFSIVGKMEYVFYMGGISECCISHGMSGMKLAQRIKLSMMTASRSSRDALLVATSNRLQVDEQHDRTWNDSLLCPNVSPGIFFFCCDHEQLWWKRTWLCGVVHAQYLYTYMCRGCDATDQTTSAWWLMEKVVCEKLSDGSWSYWGTLSP